MGAVVETRGGRLEGESGAGLAIFRGIPFAQPPVSELRFRAPQPAEPWTGVRDATRFGPSAPQSVVTLDALPGLDVGVQSEDCLYLNVFTPAADGGRRPVLVWIHGGAFTIGSGSQAMYDMRALALRGDAVVVTINYRLGALGFLHLGELGGDALGASANAGLLDQVAALEWVRDNIAAFGGDPADVTVFGESAGGMSVGTLLGMPAARGLFARAIPMSGAAHRVNDGGEATRVARQLCSELGIAAGDAAKLRSVAVDELLAAQGRVIERFEGHASLRAFCPAVDGRTLPVHPYAAIRGGLSRDVPVLVGCTRDEWKLFGLWDPEARALDEAALLARMQARLPDRAEHEVRGLVEAYRRARAARNADVSPPELFFALEGDRIFRIPAIRLAEAQAALGARSYAYLVTWESPLLGGALGACHGIDVPFVLGSIGSKGAQVFAGGGPEALRLSARMMDAWLAFARSGDPACADLPAWPRYDTGRRATMLLGRECGVAEAPLDAERAAWDGLL